MTIQINEFFAPDNLICSRFNSEDKQD